HLIFRRQDEKRERRIALADVAADAEAIGFGQHDVEDERVGPLVKGGANAILAIAGRHDLITIVAEIIANHALDALIVFNDEQLAIDGGRWSRERFRFFRFRLRHITSEKCYLGGATAWGGLTTCRAAGG